MGDLGPIDGFPAPDKILLPVDISPNGEGYTNVQRVYLSGLLERYKEVHGSQNVRGKQDLLYDIETGRWEFYLWISGTKAERAQRLLEAGYHSLGGLTTTRDQNSDTFKRVMDWLHTEYEPENILIDVLVWKWGPDNKATEFRPGIGLWAKSRPRSSQA